MHRILILDGSQDMARILKERVQDFDDYEETEVELAASSEEALEHATLASGVGRSYTMFLINQGLGSDRDGITAMKELLEINPDSDAVILNGFENSRERMQAYEAGAKRYLSKTSELKEILVVLKDIAQSSRKRIEEIRQRRQFMVAKEIAETVGAELNLERTMEAILQMLSEVFEETSLCVLLYDDKWNALKFAPATLMKQKKIQGFEKLEIAALSENHRITKALQSISILRSLALQHTGLSEAREYLFGLLFNTIFRATIAHNKNPHKGQHLPLILASIICHRLDRWDELWPPLEWEQLFN